MICRKSLFTRSAHATLLVAFVAPVQSQKPSTSEDMLVPARLFLLQDSHHSLAPVAINKVARASETAAKTLHVRAQEIPPAEDAVALQTTVPGNPAWRNAIWHAPLTNQPGNNDELMRQSQLARQQALQVDAISAELSVIAAQLAPLISVSMVCMQDTGEHMECNPQPNESQRELIGQFFNLAPRVHKLGMADNPVRMDFSAALSVSIVLLK